MLSNVHATSVARMCADTMQWDVECASPVRYSSWLCSWTRLSPSCSWKRRMRMERNALQLHGMHATRGRPDATGMHGAVLHPCCEKN